MADKLTCSQGHTWDSAIDRHRVASQRGLCPQCGDVPLAVAIPADRPGRRPESPPLVVAREPVNDAIDTAAVPSKVHQVGTVVPPSVAASEITWSRVELGPALPMPVFTCTEPWHPERIGALALYCSDGRWGDAFDEFCHKRLLIPRYDRWAVPGGPAWLVPRQEDSALSAAARHQLNFLIEVHGLERIVLITHYGCAYYKEGQPQEADELLPIQMEDLRKARKVLLEWFPAIAVDTFLAMRRNNQLTFHQVDG